MNPGKPIHAPRQDCADGPIEHPPHPNVRPLPLAHIRRRDVAQARRPSLRARLRETALQPAVQIIIALWVAANAAVLLLAGGALPFDRPALATLPFLQQVALPSAGLIGVFLLVAVVAILTRRRNVPDLAARAPVRAQAKRETICLIAYAAVGELGGFTFTALMPLLFTLGYQCYAT